MGTKALAHVWVICVGVAPAAADDDVPESAPIAVTGSRIERETLTLPMPLTVLHRDELDAAGRSMVGDIVQQRIARSNAMHGPSKDGGDGPTRMHLPGPGSSRTLRLLAGRCRDPGPLGADGSVDLSSIPLAGIDRVEILESNASAIYGSGALGGVVDIITRRNFRGAEGVLYLGSSQRADAFTYDVSAVAGEISDDHKANVMVSAGLQSQGPVLANDRAFASARARTTLLGAGLQTAHNLVDASSIDVNGDGKGDRVNVCGDGVPF